MILLVRDAQGTEVIVNVTSIVEKERTSRSLTDRNQIIVESFISDEEGQTETLDLNRYTVEVLPNG